MRKEDISIIAFAGWLTAISIFMLLSQNKDIQIFFVVSLIGFLVIVQLISPDYVRPAYLGKIRLLIAAGIIIFGVIVALKVIDIITK
jgi:hypothetical protein